MCWKWHDVAKRSLTWQEKLKCFFPSAYAKIVQASSSEEETDVGKSFLCLLYPTQVSYRLSVDWFQLCHQMDPRSHRQHEIPLPGDHFKHIVFRTSVQVLLEWIIAHPSFITISVPLDEILYWKSVVFRIEKLKAQLSDPYFLQLFQDCDSIEQIRRIFNNANWNVKYFKALEKPFEQIATGQLRTLLCAVPSIIKTLKQIWVLNRYYQSVDRMEPLLERISNALCTRVHESISLLNLLRQEKVENEVVWEIETAGSLLNRWREAYSSNDKDWGPFDQTKLFDTVDFISERCTELRYVFATLHRFHQDSIPKLEQRSKIRKESDMELDKLKERIKCLPEMLEKLLCTSIFSIARFDVFQRSNLTRWQRGLNAFRQEATEILGIIHRLEQYTIE